MRRCGKSSVVLLPGWMGHDGAFPGPIGGPGAEGTRTSHSKRRAIMCCCLDCPSGKLSEVIQRSENHGKCVFSYPFCVFFDGPFGRWMARALWKENEGWEKKRDRETIYSLNPGPENPETSPWKLVINKTFWFSRACQIESL